MRCARMLWFGGLLVLVVAPLLWSAGMVHGGAIRHWSQARWDSAGLAPDPAITPEAVVQVYAARAWGWKGVLAVHSWIILKRAGAAAFERYEVVGWGVRRGAPAIRKDMRAVDGYWAGNRPQVVAERRGPGVEQLIDRIEAAIESYPYPDQYRTWPGPNSNTFIAHIGREVPELALNMPPTAVGKDYLSAGGLLARTPSGSGFQLSVLGVLGLSLGRAEGLELNLLGLVIGVDPLGLALKLPGIGRIGLS
ncbi:MAG: hypothetical protein K0R41_4588 [Geminicoccaceae bacterium]|nr:hypothetical protein [Geminicoccaceae bacterium]MCE3250763.1 hypothetical protein [Geminicoccaceae bacterium]